ncbi:MAG: methyltransferase domain-containing protein [Candidatus ainarchaeum sp.]|nr:methyltransferase domain-containing protein [Candidatus ainarchaeum sp.]MDD3976098.1 methyltransferase domain-containing protein [Candidatus ainarchaeum sp.]
MDYNKVYKNYIKKSNDFTYIFDKTYLKEFENLKNKNILDIGCGEGRFAFTCSKKGVKIDAIDVSSKLIDFAKEYNYSKNINYYTLDFGNVDIN